MLYMGRPIVVGIPLRDDYKIDSRLSDIVNFWDSTDERVEIYKPVAFSPEEGRDKIVYHAKYRIPKPTHILFLDADIGVRKKTLYKLLEVDKDIVVGVYPIVQKGILSWSVSKEIVFQPMRIDELPRNSFRIMSSGFGIALIKYEVFEKLEWPYWKTLYRPGGVVLSEDLFFCEKARSAGYDIWCNPQVKCIHNRAVNLLSLILRKEIKNGVI